MFPKWQSLCFTDDEDQLKAYRSSLNQFGLEMPIIYTPSHIVARSASAPPASIDQEESALMDVPRSLRMAPPFTPPDRESRVQDENEDTRELIEEITRIERERTGHRALELDPRFTNALAAVYKNDIDTVFRYCEPPDVLLAVCTLEPLHPKPHLGEIYERIVRLFAWNYSEFLECHELIVDQAIKDLENANDEQIKTRMSFLLQAIFKHSSMLLEKISSLLQISLHLESALWSLLVQAIVSKQQRHIIRGCDLLTIICCFVFAVSKLVGADVSFNSLMEACRQAKVRDFEEAFLKITMGEQGVMMNIVKFYNEHFLSNFKDFILNGYMSPPRHPLLHVSDSSGAVHLLGPNVRIASSYRRSLSLDPKTQKRLCWTF